MASEIKSGKVWWRDEKWDEEGDEERYKKLKRDEEMASEIKSGKVWWRDEKWDEEGDEKCKNQSLKIKVT